MESAEKCNILMSLFQTIINDMKDSAPAFEDLSNKTTKLHSSLRAAIASTTMFLEAFQKVADIATNSRGATKEIGKALTRLCLRQRSIESKLKTFASALLERLAVPLQETVAEWQKAIVQLDKDHARDHKKARAEIKRASGDTVRLQRKAKKGKTTYCKSDAKEKLESAMQGVTGLYKVLEESEKRCVRQALIQERKQFCYFITCIDPVVAAELSMIDEVVHLQEILDTLCGLAADPDNLPEASEFVISDVNRADVKYTYHSPPDSPASLVRSSRKSSVSSLSSLASVSEADSAIGVSPNHGVSQKTSHGSAGDLGDQSSLSSKHSSYHSGGRSGASGIMSDEACETGSLRVPTAASASEAYNWRHTISVAAGGSVLGETAYHHSARPSLQPDTFVPPTPLSMTSPGLLSASELQYATSHSRTPSPIMVAPIPAVVMPPPPKPLRSLTRRDTVHGVGSVSGSYRNLPPRMIRAKPVALPSVPFMTAEPVYMNTQELAARIAEKRQQQAADKRQQQDTGEHPQQETDKRPQQETDKRPQQETDKRPQQQEVDMHLRQQEEIGKRQQELAVAAAEKRLIQEQPHQQQLAAMAAAAALGSRTSAAILTDRQNESSALADAIKELEATTAALNETYDGLATMPSSAAWPPSLPPSKEVSTPSSRDIDLGSVQPHRVNVLADGDETDRDSLRMSSRGHPVQTWAGPAVLRRSASVKPPPPIRKSSSVSSPRSLEADCPPTGRVSAESLSSVAGYGSTPDGQLATAEPGRPGSTGQVSAAGKCAPTEPPARQWGAAGVHVTDPGLPAVGSGRPAGEIALAVTAAVSQRPSPMLSTAAPTGGVPAGNVSMAFANGIAFREEVRALAATTGVSSATPMSIVAAKTSGTKAPPPTVAAKPTARRETVVSGYAPEQTASALPSPASSAKHSSYEKSPPLASASLPPWERSASSASAASQAPSSQDGTGLLAFTRRMGSEFMASLSAKLTAGTAAVGGSGSGATPDGASSGTASALLVRRSQGASVAPCESAGAYAFAPTPVGSLTLSEPPTPSCGPDDLLTQIHNGVRLKRAQTDDRSSPRISLS